MKSQEQEYMLKAWDFVEEADKNKLIDKDKYAGRVQSTPVLIHDTGLMQTLAFFISKKKEEHLQLLACQLMGWLTSEVGSDSNLPDRNWKLYKKLKEKSSDEIMLYTKQILALLQWLKRFSEAKLKQE